MCEPSHPGRALNEHSGGGKEGGGGGRATPARIPPPKGSGERLLSTVSARTRALSHSSSCLPCLHSPLAARESNSPASLRQLRDQKIPRRQGATRKDRGRSPKAPRKGGREGSGGWRGKLRRETAKEEEEEEGIEGGKRVEERTGDQVEASSVARRTRTVARPQPMSIARSRSPPLARADRTSEQRREGSIYPPP